VSVVFIHHKTALLRSVT